MLSAPAFSSYAKCSAIVVLPAAGNGRIASPELRRWLARANLSERAMRRPDWATVLAELGCPLPLPGAAALRYWGDAGTRPDGWLAAADPVYLEPRLDHLGLHALAGDVSGEEIARLLDHLKKQLADESIRFRQQGKHAYLASAQGFATATTPPEAIDGQRPDEHIVTGPAAAPLRRLASEIEMALHEHPVNLERLAAGRRPVNALWLWGGGEAPPARAGIGDSGDPVPLPALYADDALLRGAWMASRAPVAAWPGDIAPCLDGAEGSFVAVAPADASSDDTERWLVALKDAVQSRHLRRLVLWFRDGLRAEVTPGQFLRVWRQRARFLDAGADP